MAVKYALDYKCKLLKSTSVSPRWVLETLESAIIMHFSQRKKWKWPPLPFLKEKTAFVFLGYLEDKQNWWNELQEKHNSFLKILFRSFIHLQFCKWSLCRLTTKPIFRMTAYASYLPCQPLITICCTKECASLNCRQSRKWACVKKQTSNRVRPNTYKQWTKETICQWKADGN